MSVSLTIVNGEYVSLVVPASDSFTLKHRISKLKSDKFEFCNLIGIITLIFKPETKKMKYFYDADVNFTTPVKCSMTFLITSRKEKTVYYTGNDTLKLLI